MSALWEKNKIAFFLAFFGKRVVWRGKHGVFPFRLWLAF